MNQLWSGMNVKCSHTHNNNHRLQKLTKRSQQSDKQSEQCSVPSKGPFLTDSWSWMKSSARNTLSNQQAQPKEAETVNLTENVAKDTFKGSLFDCQENVSHYTYYCLNNQCEY